MNILVIFSDQQHKYALGKTDPTFKTPNLDRLCDEGVLFENGYSNNPVCGPYRGCLMTGRYTSYSRVYVNCAPLPKGVPTIASTLKNAGYETAFVGKWHLGGNGIGPITEDIRGGFQHFIGYQCYNGFDPAPPFNNEVSFYDEHNCKHTYQKHRTDVTTDLAVDMLKTLKRSGRPFFAVVGYQAPHYPEQPSPIFEHLYDGVTFEKTPDYQEVDPYTPTYSPPSKKPVELCPDYQRYGNNMDRYQQLYAGLVSQIDAGVGRILETMEQLRVLDDTLIIYTSDHGDMQGSHGLKNKCFPYEKSCGVPFLIRHPHGRRGERCRIPVSGVDIFPTALAAAQVQPEAQLDGISLYDYVSGKQELTDGYVIAEYFLPTDMGYPWRMIRDSRYKLVVDATDEKPMLLFDMTNDPYELHNLKDLPEYQHIITSRKEILLRRTRPLPDQLE